MDLPGDSGLPALSGQGVDVRIVESPRRLSESSIWRLERGYFEQRGIQAWASGDVPHSGTNNTVQARAYAQLLEGVLADAAAGAFGRFEPSEPVHVVELGAGSGAFAFHFLQALEPAVLPANPVYVLSDLAESNLAFWKENPALAPFVDAGRLDMACFDATSDQPVRLEQRGIELRPGELANPLVFFANYFFDVLPQDLFVVEDGVLYEEAVALALPSGALALDDDLAFTKLFMATERRPVGPAHYGDTLLDAVLADVAGTHTPRGRFPFPSTALRMLRNLLALSGGRMVVVSNERPEALSDIVDTLVAQAGGDANDPRASEDVIQRFYGATVTADDSAAGADGTAVALVGQTALRAFALTGLLAHGSSFSLPVERAALAALARQWDGELVQPSVTPQKTAVTALIAGGGPVPHTRRRFALAFDEGGPDDRFAVVSTALATRASNLAHADAAEGRNDATRSGVAPDAGDEPTSDDETEPLVRVFALLRTCCYDTEVFGMLYPLFAASLADAHEQLVDETVTMLGTVCDRHYPIGSKSDPAMASAALLAPIGRYAEALEFLARSVHQRGPQSQASYNAALCHLHLGEIDEALASVDEALSLPNPPAAATELREVILKERDAAPGSG
ncbi:MAG TPA: SAM-dependent methyltransferase [Acidimicrobiales bacterium]